MLSRHRQRVRRLCGAVLAGLAWAFMLQAARAQEEVPFITTPDSVTLAMLELAQLRAGERLIDLGSGDGRIVITAARRFGARGLGVEIVPELVLRSRRNAVAAGVAERVEFREQDLFQTDLADAQVITMYLLPEVNLQLRPALLALAPGTRIVSHDWDMGDWLPERSQTLAVPDKSIGREKISTVHLWVVPARVQGLWCGPGAQLRIEQRFQTFSATLSQAGVATPVRVFDGRVGVQALWAGRHREGSDTVLELQPGALHWKQAAGASARWQGQRFSAATGEVCR